VSNSRFYEGDANFNVIITEGARDPSGRLLLGFTSIDAEYYSVGIGGADSIYTLYEFNRSGWIPKALAGVIFGQEYKLNVRLRGQRLRLDDDGIRVFEEVLQPPLSTGQLGLYGWGEDPIEFTSTSVKATRGNLFVVMQFSGRPYQELYTDVIQPVAEGAPYNLHVYRADEVFGPGLILDDIIRAIVEAKIIIAPL